VFDSIADIVKVAALLLAILIPSIATWATYRREERKSKQPPSIGSAGIAAIGGMIMSEDSIEKAIQTAHEVRESINRLARSLELMVEEMQHDRDLMKRLNDRYCDELVAARRAFEKAMDEIGRSTVIRRR
jgi:hypothetical protein